MPKRISLKIKYDPDQMVPIHFRVRGALANALMDAAERNNRTLGEEIESRLLASFDSA
jgi:hypothetical protein